MAKTDVENMVIALQADLRQYERNMQRAWQTTQRRATAIESRLAQMQKRGQAAFAGIGAALGIGGGAFAFAGLSKAIDNLDRIAKRASALGFTAEQLQVLEFNAERSGVSIEGAGTALRTFVNLAGDAARGSRAAAAPFEALGVSVEDLRNKGTQEILEQVADGLAKIADPKIRASLAGDIFGARGGAAFVNVLKDGAKGMAEMEATARRLGIVISNDIAAKAEVASDKMTDFKRVLSSYGTVLAVEVMPGMISLLDYLTKIAAFLAANPKIFAMLTGAAGGAAIGGRAGPWGAGIGGVLGAMGGLGGYAMEQASTAEARLKTLRGEVEALDRSLQYLNKGLAGPGGYRTGPDEIARQTEMRAAKLKEIAELEASLAAPAPAITDFSTPGGPRDLGSAPKGQQNAFDRAAEKIRQQTDELNAQATATDRSAQAAAVLSAQMDLLAAATRDNKELTPELRAEIEALATSLGDAKSAAALSDMMEEAGRAIAEVEAYTAALGLSAAEADIFAFEQNLVNQALREFGTISADVQRQINEQVAAYRVARTGQEEVTRALENQIAVQDGVRQGMIDIGLAATRGADDFTDAIGNMLRRLADLIIELYVLKPLVESIFGAMGTGGGGSLGSLLGTAIGSIGFASGTANTGGRRGEPRGIVHGQEAVIPLPAGGKVPVMIRTPDIGRVARPEAGGQTIVNVAVDARGATDPAAVDMAVQRGMREVLAQVPGISIRSVAGARGRGGAIGRALK